MARAKPSLVPPKMYRHFAVVTVLLTAGIAMFAEGENRQARAAQVASQEGARPKPAVEALQPPPTRRKPRRRQQFLQETGGFDGFDASFGMPMDLASSAPSSPAGTAASDATQAGYSEAYLSSLDPEERDLLLAGLANEGVLSPRDRQRKSAALIAASQARSGASAANY